MPLQTRLTVPATNLPPAHQPQPPTLLFIYFFFFFLQNPPPRRINRNNHQIQTREGAAREGQCGRVHAAQDLRPPGRDAHGRERESRAQSQVHLSRAEPSAETVSPAVGGHVAASRKRQVGLLLAHQTARSVVQVQRQGGRAEDTAAGRMR